ncbi:hypothetical protein [Streptomyces virginiae]|uniref:hypothetical protein n=1 Tax=Streptomyces virginiae TaxID=1961 RepID=UPI003669A00F
MIGGPILLALLPINLESPDRLAPGSLWLKASALVPGRQSDEFVGMCITGGAVEWEGIVSSTGSSVTVDRRWRLRVEPDLEVPPAGPVSTSDPGMDAAQAVVNLPASAAFEFTPTRSACQFADAEATVYGSTIRLTRSQEPPRYEHTSRAIVVPGEPSESEFAFTDVRSDLWSVRGTATLGDCGWALPVSRLLPGGTVAQAEGVGALALGMVTPLQGSWRGLSAPLRFPAAMMSVEPGSITMRATLGDPGVTQRLRLWDESASPPRRSGIDFTAGAEPGVLYEGRPGSEDVRLRGRVVGHLDRPLAADGGRIPLTLSGGRLVLSRRAEGTDVTVVADDPGAAADPPLAVMLENALLKVRPPGRLEITGRLAEDEVTEGKLRLRCAGVTLLPTLPDPYAANELPRRSGGGSFVVLATVSWSAPSAPELSFTAGHGVRRAITRDAAGRGSEWEPTLVLLDVSGNADQFGVALPVEDMGALSVDGLSLKAPGDVAGVFTLPPISWEPMLTRTPDSSGGDIALLAPPHDGGPAGVQVRDERVGDFAPRPLLAAYLDALAAGQSFRARLPLPFGLVAYVDTLTDSGQEGANVSPNQPSFAGPLVGGAQLAIRGRGITAPDGRDPELPGHVEAEGDYPKSVLSTNVYDRFVGDFSDGVPVRHYELSGYGASLFSDWRDRAAVGPAIIQARFDVLVGRTSHEVIQMQSILYPLHVRVVRVITIDRTRGGWVLREDSGWVAAGEGRLDYKGDPAGLPDIIGPAFSEEVRHPGAFEATENIRNIRLSAPSFSLRARAGEPDQTSTKWQPVSFDCDIAFAEPTGPRLAAREGSSNRRAPARGCTGWILIDGPVYWTMADDGNPVRRVSPATAQQVFDLLASQGPGLHPVDCVLNLGGTEEDPGLVLRAARVDVSCDRDDDAPHLVAAVRGSPVLPRDGAWSLARLMAGESAPKALDPSFPVPVVRPNDKHAGSGRWHLADPADITSLGDTASPTIRYGLVQSLGTQKVFFERPRVGNDPKPVTLPRPPRLADVGALLGAVGAFPGLADAFDFAALRDLAVSNGGLEFDDSFPLNATKETVLMDLGGPDALQVLLDYHDEHGGPTKASIRVAPGETPRWKLSLSRVCFLVRYRGQPLVSIFGTVTADEQNAPTVVDLWVGYGGVLKVLESLFTNLQRVARFLPGAKDAGLKVGFTPGHLTVRNTFAVPNLPLGAGQITDVAVNMGLDVCLAPRDVRFVAGLGSQAEPFRWIVSPLAGTGVVQVAIGPDGLDILVQAGLGLGLAIDLGIASGAASVAIAFELNTEPYPFEIRAILSGRASVDVLQGLASATLTLGAGLGVIPPPQLFQPPFMPPEIPPALELPAVTVGFTASVSVGIHLSLCWVADVDWDGYWQFRQDITTPKIPFPL